MPSLSRRTFLKTSAAAGGALLVSFDVALAADSGQARQLSAWLEIRPDGQYLFRLNQVEMGQGVSAALITLFCEGADIPPGFLETLQPKASSSDPEGYYAFGTGGSGSVRRQWQRMSEAGAEFRALMVNAAAKKMNVATGLLETDKAVVYDRQGGRSFKYVELIDGAAAITQIEPVPPIDREKRYVGKLSPDASTLDKITGKRIYGLDVQADNQLVAVIERCPFFGGEPLDIDDSAASLVAAVVDIVPMYHGVAVLAEHYWAAEQARKLLKIQWSDNPEPSLDDETIEQQYQLAEREPGELLRGSDEGYDAHDGDSLVEASYELPFLSQSPLEPMNCVAEVMDGRCRVWAPTQDPQAARGIASAVSGLPESSVDIYVSAVGGGFGRRLEQDYVTEAVYLARRSQRPVKLLWSREDDFRQGWYRPKAKISLQAKLSPQGELRSFTQHLTGPGVLGSVLPAGAKASQDSVLGRVKNALSEIKREYLPDQSISAFQQGAMEKPYSLPAEKIIYHYCNTGVPVGYWRSVGHSLNVYALECFIDELAVAMASDPLRLRKHLLHGDRRSIELLEQLQHFSGWQTGVAGFGLAFCKAYGSYIGLVVKLTRADGRPRVSEVFCVADCGSLVNPDTVRSQIEGGILFGLSAALYEQINVSKAAVVQSNFHDYPILRIQDSPAIHIQLRRNNELPGGVGEIAVPAVAPAVCNGLFSLSGQRVNSLPVYGSEQSA